MPAAEPGGVRTTLQGYVEGDDLNHGGPDTVPHGHLPQSHRSG